MNETKNFAIYEDRDNWARVFREFLEDRGHNVVILEDERVRALNTISVPIFTEKNIFGALVDGQLLGGSDGNLDGIDLADAIIALNMGVHVFSIAGIPLVRAEFAFDKLKILPELDRFGKHLTSIGA